MVATTSELRLPADPTYIIVAKRAAAGFASLAGFDVEAVHDLVIAVAQACENAIGCAERAGGIGAGQLRLTFTLEEQRLEVQVQSSCSRAHLQSARELQAQQITNSSQQSVARGEAERRGQEAAIQRANDVALRLMGLFVDDFGYRVNERTGGLRVTLTKYRVS